MWLRLPPELEGRLEALAKAHRHSTSEYALEAILQHLEDIEDVNLAEGILSKVRSGEMATHSLDDLQLND